uniref:Uncharacterized protein n=1 Tax=Aegilops tauschii subsp. strangulata TaxID=200361 RepID=A0A453ATC1_AEGTS
MNPAAARRNGEARGVLGLPPPTAMAPALAAAPPPPPRPLLSSSPLLTTHRIPRRRRRFSPTTHLDAAATARATRAADPVEALTATSYPAYDRLLPCPSKDDPPRIEHLVAREDEVAGDFISRSLNLPPLSHQVRGRVLRPCCAAAAPLRCSGACEDLQRGDRAFAPSPEGVH